MKDILIITVNYRNTSVTEDFIHSLEKVHEFQRVQLVIVDSASTNATKEELEALLHNSSLHTQIICSDQNTYYWGGVALAIKHLKLEFSMGPKWLIACNNDILFTQQDFLKQLIALDPDKYPVIGPTIYSSVTGKNLNPAMAKPINIFGKFYYSILFINPKTARLIQIIRQMTQKLFYTVFKRSTPTSGKIYAPHGSLMIFSKHYFTRGGWIDDNFKLYGEEISTAEIALNNNLEIHYLPQLEVSHVDHSSTGTNIWQDWFYHAKETYKYLKKAYL
jgi:GT2 family glycosyltransferase